MAGPRCLFCRLRSAVLRFFSNTGRALWKAPSLWFCCFAAVAPSNAPRGLKGGRGVLGCGDIPATGLRQRPASPSAPCPQLGGLGSVQLDAAQAAPAAATPPTSGTGALLLLATRPVGTARGRGTGQLPPNMSSYLTGEKSQRGPKQNRVQRR